MAHDTRHFNFLKMVASKLCFCTDFKNALRIEKIALLDPVSCKSKITLCACRPCINDPLEVILPWDFNKNRGFREYHS